MRGEHAYIVILCIEVVAACCCCCRHPPPHLCLCLPLLMVHLPPPLRLSSPKCLSCGLLACALSSTCSPCCCVIADQKLLLRQVRRVCALAAHMGQIDLTALASTPAMTDALIDPLFSYLFFTQVVYLKVGGFPASTASAA
jgi:hypothetical protein